MGDDRGTEFWSTVLGLLRRKRVIIPALLVALTLGVVAYSGTPTSYVSSTTMVLTTTEYGGTQSQDPTSPTDLTNPMLNFNDSLRTTAAILIEAMNTKGVADQLGVDGSTRLTVNDGRTNPNLLGLNGPFLYIIVTSISASEAERVVKETQKLMRQKLKEWQGALNAPQKTFVSLTDVVAPNAPEPDRGQGTKLGLMAFLFGFLLCVGIAYFGHQFGARRRARAAARAVAGRRPLVVDAEEGRLSPPAHSPVLVPEHDQVDKHENKQANRQGDREDAEPVSVSSSLSRRPELAHLPPPMKKAQVAVVPAPVKLKVRSRNR